MRAMAWLLAGLTVAGVAHAADGAPPTVAVFNFEMVNTSPAPTTPEEEARLVRLNSQLRDMLTATKQYTVVDDDAERAAIAKGPSIRGCNGCELDAAKKAGAQYAAYGWIQKVSNLIMNVNVIIEDADTGRQVKAGSADMRGNTDESWQRGLRYLMNERLFRTEDP